jgi:hypothetical protein
MSEAKTSFVQRILSKIVGEEISAEELELVSGGLQDSCPPELRTYGDGPFHDCTV